MCFDRRPIYLRYPNDVKRCCCRGRGHPRRRSSPGARPIVRVAMAAVPRTPGLPAVALSELRRLFAEPRPRPAVSAISLRASFGAGPNTSSRPAWPVVWSRLYSGHVQVHYPRSTAYRLPSLVVVLPCRWVNGRRQGRSQPRGRMSNFRVGDHPLRTSSSHPITPCPSAVAAYR